MYWKLEDFTIGTAVMFVPKHLREKFTLNEVERGVVSSTNDSFVFVKFNSSLNNLGWEDTTAQACKVEDLFIIGALDVDFVKIKETNDINQQLINFVHANSYDYPIVLKKTLGDLSKYIFGDDRILEQAYFYSLYKGKLKRLVEEVNKDIIATHYVGMHTIIKERIERWKKMELTKKSES